MFLKSLSLRGFKSFAEKTELAFEPGITVIVGPNGSGKSNIVDALTWVLGTHSAKSLRGAAMSDVIFAGAPGRAALGRANVSITIDNASGTLPIEFSEVAISREIFASGENGYAINDVDCRLLDVTELLSDTGLGRESHTIVGQGQLDTVLNAKPEDRRALIEEAAGILKHRKRKERALRKLAQMDAHTERLGDVLRELRRNLRPLERQAEAAKTHTELSQKLRDVRLERVLREHHILDLRLRGETAAGATTEARLAKLTAELEAARTQEAAHDGELSRLAPTARAASETHFRLANLVERTRGLGERIEERRRGLIDAVEEPVAGRDPAELRAAAQAEREQGEALEQAVRDALGALTDREQARRGAEQARRAHEQAAAAEARRRAEARERQLRWEGEIAALRSSLAQASSEEGRLASQLSGLRSRTTELAGAIDDVDSEIQRLDTASDALANQLRDAEQKVAGRGDVAHDAAREERDLERQRASLEARVDALRAAAAEATAGAAALSKAATSGRVSDVLGPLAEHITIAEGMAPAVAAALGPLGDALVVVSPTAAADAIGFCRDSGAGRVVLLVADAGAVTPADEGSDPDPVDAAAGAAQDVPAEGDDAVDDDADEAAPPASTVDAELPVPPIPDRLSGTGARPLVEAITAAPAVVAGLGRALARVYAVADFATACRLATEHPDATFVSVDGNIAGPRFYAGGSRARSSAVLSAAAADDAARQLEVTESELLRAHRRLADADREVAAARTELDAATAAMQESDGLITAAAERLKRLRAEHAAAESELAGVESAAAALATEVAEQRERLDALEGRSSDVVESDDQSTDGPDLEAERLDDELAAARETEVEARLALNGAERQVAEVARQVRALETEADDVEARLAERERRRAARLLAIDRCDELTVVASAALARAESSSAAAAAERDRLEHARGEVQGALGVVRARLREVEAAVGELRAERHAEDLRTAELRHTAAAVAARLREEFGTDPDAALADVRTRSGLTADGAVATADEGIDWTGEQATADSDDQVAPPTPEAPTTGPLSGGAARDAALAQAEEKLVRKLGLLGTVNPLALEEFESLKERHGFLTTELEDLKTARRDLIEVVEAVDGRIRDVFAEAFAEVATQFERIFPLLFPGGSGKLVLTDPEDMLLTGVEVEARPPGKRIKRLSLLSGGERSLTALAVLFSIFAARPSPFYVLDEVEAALDDVNLQRFLSVVQEFRTTSQLLIVSHQKRTMEVADVLYGVTMQRDGVSKVISERLSEATAAR